MPEHSYAGLYYPFIHFKNDGWLKLSALYWDKMGRIVPTDYLREDSDTVKKLGDFVVNLPPEWVAPSLGERFRELVEQYGGNLRQSYGLSGRAKWGPVPATRRPPPAGGMSGTDPRLSYVFYEKMSKDLRSQLIESDLVLPDPIDPRWIGMHPKLADVYMTAMADQLAAERGLYPVTDEAIDHVAVGGWSMERLAQALLPDVSLTGSMPTSREVEALAACVAIQSVIPKNIENLSVEKILRFRETYPVERGAFQRYMHEFVKPREWLNDVSTATVLEERLQAEYKKSLKPKVDELREQYHDVGIATTVGAMTIKVGVPALAAKGAMALGIVLNPIGAAAAVVALALVPVLQDRRKRNRELKASDVAYLMRLEDRLRPRTLIDRVWNASRKFRVLRAAHA